MKDLFLLAFVFGCLVVSLRYPFAGVITWAWFTIMTPHQMAYGTFGIPLNLLIAGVTLFAVVYSREAQRFRADPITLLLLVFLLWQTVAQHLSLLPAVSGEYYSRLSKTLIFTLLCAQMVTDKLRFHAITWVLAGGIGFFAVKGALFTLVTLGQYRVQGLENTVLEDNNHFGIAVATMIPLLAFMRQQSRHARENKRLKSHVEVVPRPPARRNTRPLTGRGDAASQDGRVARECEHHLERPRRDTQREERDDELHAGQPGEQAMDRHAGERRVRRAPERGRGREREHEAHRLGPERRRPVPADGVVEAGGHAARRARQAGLFEEAARCHAEPRGRADAGRVGREIRRGDEHAGAADRDQRGPHSPETRQTQRHHRRRHHRNRR